VNPARALDFGCGVGRLAQALLPRFERVDGVDIAPSMLELAARYNKDPARCVFHLNERADLALFPDRSFTFIYTSLVLQHVATSSRAATSASSCACSRRAACWCSICLRSRFRKRAAPRRGAAS
jgi:ubiquinone/menaquinone biosynthesis C-methylase UbiE